jgi:hypothetical protein
MPFDKSFLIAAQAGRAAMRAIERAIRYGLNMGYP